MPRFPFPAAPGPAQRAALSVAGGAAAPGPGPGRDAAGGGGGGRASIVAGTYLSAGFWEGPRRALAAGGASLSKCIAQRSSSLVVNHGAPGTLYLQCTGCDEALEAQSLSSPQNRSLSGSRLLVSNRADAADESLATAQVTPLGEDSDALPWRADLLSHLFVQDSAMARCVVAREPPLGLPVYLGAHLAVLEAGDLQVNILGDSASLTPVALEYLCLALGGGSSMLFLGNVFLTAPEIAQEGRFDARACSSAGLPPGSITVLGGSRLGIQTSATSASSSSSRVSARSIQVSESSAIVSSGKLQISGMAEVESTVLSVGTDLRCQPLPKDQSMLRANILLVREFSSVCIGDQSKIQAPYTLPPSGCPTEVAFHVACTGRRGARTRPGGAGAGAGAGAGTERPWSLLEPRGVAETRITLEVQTVADLLVYGELQGSAVQLAQVSRVVVNPGGAIDASGRGCAPNAGPSPGNQTSEAVDAGQEALAVGGGGAHAAIGGRSSAPDAEGGAGVYGNASCPAEVGSGGGGTGGGRGGGVLVMGSPAFPLSLLDLVGGAVSANGGEGTKGGGGGAGGSVLVFTRQLRGDDGGAVTAVGGAGGSGGGGGGSGGRIHFEWDPTALAGLPTVCPSPPALLVHGGMPAPPSKGAMPGGVGSTTGTACPRGHAGVFCQQCLPGFYTDQTGAASCEPCQAIPGEARYTEVGAASLPCAFECTNKSARTDPLTCEPFKEGAGGDGDGHRPRAPGELLRLAVSVWGITLAILAAVATTYAVVTRSGRAKGKGAGGWGRSTSTARFALSGWSSSERTSGGDYIFLGDSTPDGGGGRLESLSDVLSPNSSRAAPFVRLTLRGTGSVTIPWRLSSTSPPSLTDKVIHAEHYARFVSQCNSYAQDIGSLDAWLVKVAKVLHPPFASFWSDIVRRRVGHKLAAFSQSVEAHAFLRSSRARALQSSLYFEVSDDLSVAYIDVRLNEEEKGLQRAEASLQPVVMVFNGYGTYLRPFWMQETEGDPVQGLLWGAVPQGQWQDLFEELNRELHLCRRLAFWQTVSGVLEVVKRIDREVEAAGINVHLCRFPHSLGRLGLVVVRRKGQTIEELAECLECEVLEYWQTLERAQAAASSPSARLRRWLAHAVTINRRSESSLRLVRSRQAFLVAFSFLLLVDLCFTVVTVLIASQQSVVLLLVLCAPPLSFVTSPLHGYVTAYFTALNPFREDGNLAWRRYNIDNARSAIAALAAAVGVLAFVLARSNPSKSDPFGGGGHWVTYPTVLFLVKAAEVQMVDQYLSLWSALQD